MNYNELKQIQKNERESSFLSKLPIDFYEETSDYFCELEKNITNEDDFRIYHNAFNCYTGIVEVRLNKITQTAFFTILRKCQLNQEHPEIDSLTKDLPANILNAEKLLFNQLIHNYVLFYEQRYNAYKISKEAGGK